MLDEIEARADRVRDASVLTHAEARRYIDRAIAKAAELRQSGAVVVVDAAGNVVSISKMDGAPAVSAGVARAKAFVAAVMQQRTQQFTERMNAAPERFAAYRDIFAGIGLPGGVGFPGAGGMPILRDDDRCVGGIASGPGIAPLREVAGVHPARFEVGIGNFSGNAEDIVICHALGVPYRSQHG
jgi:glc operon protein GlcG